MKKHQDIEKSVQQTLNSLDNLQQLNANDYLFAKIKQRLADTARVVPMQYNRLMLRLAAVLVLFIGLNCASFYISKQNTTVNTTPKTGADAFAKDYNLNTNADSY